MKRDYSHCSFDTMTMLQMMDEAKERRLMNELKHTSGPWKFSTSPQPNGCPIVGANGLMICMLAHSVNHEDQKETALANARLIAAAPDLLDALQNLLFAHENADETGYVTDGGFINVEDIREKAHAVIAKALGTPTP